MIVECFLDTNILIYAASRKKTETTKKKKAIELIRNTKFGLSAQVLQEFYAVTTKKPDWPLKPVEALEWLEYLEEFPCVSIDASLVKIAAEMSERFRISYWDGAILAAAQTLGASILYTEDLNSGQVYGAIRVCNPF